jgi:hypothetical protein
VEQESVMPSSLRHAVTAVLALGALGGVIACSAAPVAENERSSESAQIACAAETSEFTIGEGELGEMELLDSADDLGDDEEPEGLPADVASAGEGADEGLAPADVSPADSGVYAIFPRAGDAGTARDAGDAGSCKPVWCSDPARGLTAACQAAAGDRWGGNKKDQYYRLQKYWCYGKKPDGTTVVTDTGWIKPKPGDDCTALKERANRARNCIRARRRVRECYVPACQDAKHQQSIDEANNALDNVLGAGGKVRPPCVNL